MLSFPGTASKFKSCIAFVALATASANTEWCDAGVLFEAELGGAYSSTTCVVCGGSNSTESGVTGSTGMSMVAEKGS